MADDGSTPSSASVPSSTPELLSALQLLQRSDSDEPLRRLLPDQPLDDDAALDVLTAATALPVAAQLDVLSRAVSSPRVPNDEALHAFAASLVRPEIRRPADREAIGSRLIDRLGPDVAGDPLGRDPGNLARPHRPFDQIDLATESDPSDVGGMVDLLAPGIADNVWDIECVSGAATVGGVRVLRIASDLYTRTEIGCLVPMADPTRWTEGPLGDAFFRNIAPQNPRKTLIRPDSGWNGTIVETVDFSLGLSADGHVFVTDLDIMCWDNRGAGVPPPPPSPWTATRSVGMTYRLSRDGRAAARPDPDDPERAICFDSGYVIVDELIPPAPDSSDPGLCRIRTLKEVAFRNGREAPFADLACPIWSWATCLIVDDANGSHDEIEEGST